jgi:DeoR family suf operon transcriptional repressor
VSDVAQARLVELSPAQKQVVVTIKKRGESSAEELAQALGITPSGVRQHLAALKAAGVVAARQERGRPGRPTNLYHGTDLAEALLPTASVDLSVELLDHIEEEDPQLVSRIFERRRDRRVAQARTRIAGKNLDDKMAFLAGMLDDEGYLADFEKLPDGVYRMTLHSCVIWAVASRYGQACTTELEFLRDVLPEVNIERIAHKAAGAYACGYEIRDPSGSAHVSHQQIRP